MCMCLKAHYKNEVYEIQPSVEFHQQIFDITKEQTFVYINQETYNKLPQDIINEMSEYNFEDTIPQNGEEPKITLEEILQKKVVFVKSTKPEEIDLINSLRIEFTKEDSYIIIE